jgi:hypothetical protein
VIAVEGSNKESDDEANDGANGGKVNDTGMALTRNVNVVGTPGCWHGLPGLLPSVLSHMFNLTGE